MSATIPFWSDVITLDDVASGKTFTRDKNHYGRFALSLGVLAEWRIV
jgi:hypothetical protein